MPQAPCIRASEAPLKCASVRHILKIMTMRFEVFGGSPGVPERLIRREDLSGDQAAAALAAPLRSLGFEKVTLVFEQPLAT